MESPAAHELMKSQDYLAQLVFLLNNKNASEEKLAVEAMAAISKALSLLQDAGRTEDARRRSPSQCSYEATSVVNSAPKGKLKATNKAAKRRSHPHMCSLLSKTLDDGFTWRKYGQKDILSQSDRPRSYYRCTHKPRGCPAIRQVQRSQEHPSSYVITYIGQHTCRDARPNPFSSVGAISSDPPPPAASTLAIMPKQESDHDTSSTLSHQLQLDAYWEDEKHGFGSSISSDIDSMVDSFLVDQISCFDHDVVFFGI